MFKNLIYALERNGHKYLVVVNDKEITSQLLESFEIKFTKIGNNKAGILNKVIQLILLTIKTIIISLKFRPDIYVGQAIPHLGFSSFIMRKPFLIFEDTESSKYLQKVVNPFADVIITPNSYREIDNEKISIDGGFELAYLHPKTFKPQKEVLNKLGLEDGEKFVIIRFVSWNANHDIGHKGLSKENKIKVVKEFSKKAKLFISSEAPLPVDIEKYRFSIEPHQMHHALYYCTLVYGESASMAAEAAYLGTPAIYLDDVGRGYTDVLENKYKLVYNFTESKEDQLRSIQKGVEILSREDYNVFSDRRRNLLDSSIDVNKFMYWFVTEFPESHSTMKKDPNSQYNFR
jgi:predicted glycosyltransferase